MPLKDLVVYLANKNATGVLSLQRDVVRKQVLITNGTVVNASSNEPREYLGQFLINLGKISEDQFQRAYQTQKDTRVFLGRILVMIGAVSEQEVVNALSLKMRETLLEAYQWKQGTFGFEAGKTVDTPDGIDLSVPLKDIAQEGEFRESVWKAIRTVFPHGSCVLKLDRAKLAESPKPGSLDEKLYHLIDSGNSIDEIVLALHATDFFLYQRLFALQKLDAVSVANPDGALDIDMASINEPMQVGVEEQVSGDALLAHVREFLKAGNYRDALNLARKAHELSPSPEADALARQAESTWLGELKNRLVATKRVPTLMVPPSKLKAMQLSAPERYLLSRIDGKRDLGSIVNVSPLRELEALAHFEKFLEMNLISLA